MEGCTKSLSSEELVDERRAPTEFEMALSIVNQFLEQAYGALGSREFRIDKLEPVKTKRAPEEKVWKASLTRSVDDLIQRFEIYVDLVRMGIIWFKRIEGKEVRP